MNYAAYLANVKDRLNAQGFGDYPLPGDLTPGLGLAMDREESWGRLIIALVGELNLTDLARREALVSATGAWVRSLIRGDGGCQLILVFPFDRRVSEEESAAIAQLRQQGGDQRWAVIPWTADLEVELLDRHTGFPVIDLPVVQALTEVPRSQVESLVRRTTGPKVGRPRVMINLDHVPTTRLIMALTIAYYLWSVLMSSPGLLGAGLGGLLSGPSSSALVTWGANWTVLTLGTGEQWRLFTYMLLHGGLWHLGFNMWALWNLGRHVELIYGSLRMLFIYVVAGVVGGVASVALRPGMVLSVGASGAVFGLLGALIYFASSLKGRRINWHGLWTPLVLNLMLGFMLGFVDNYAHIGGFLGGVVASFLAGIPGKRPAWRTGGMLLATLLTLLLLVGLLPLRHISTLLG